MPAKHSLAVLACDALTKIESKRPRDPVPVMLPLLLSSSIVIDELVAGYYGLAAGY